jgi:hypothetical protein
MSISIFDSLRDIKRFNWLEEKKYTTGIDPVTEVWNYVISKKKTPEGLP